MGLTQAKVSDMMRGDFSNLLERKLMDWLTRLGHDIEIKVKPTREPIGQEAREEQAMPVLVGDFGDEVVDGLRVVGAQQITQRPAMRTRGFSGRRWFRESCGGRGTGFASCWVQLLAKASKGAMSRASAACRAAMYC